jgi:hypothetical protein
MPQPHRAVYRRSAESSPTDIRTGRCTRHPIALRLIRRFGGDLTVCLVAPLVGSVKIVNPTPSAPRTSLNHGLARRGGKRHPNQCVDDQHGAFALQHHHYWDVVRSRNRFHTGAAQPSVEIGGTNHIVNAQPAAEPAQIRLSDLLSPQLHSPAIGWYGARHKSWL